MMAGCISWLLVVLTTFHMVAAARADPMHFVANTTGGNHCCSWVQATGEIAEDTAKAFTTFTRTTQFVPHVVRLNSPGGNLVGGTALGQAFRTEGFATEVGSSKPYQNPINNGQALFEETPGVCASACAYAFLGGTARTLDPDSRLGFHQFFAANALTAPTAKLFSGQDLDATQRLTAALVLYIVQMGVDPRLIGLASEASPDQVTWVTSEQAHDLRIAFEPSSYQPWQVEPYEAGAVAVSKSNDSAKRIIAACTKTLGPFVALVDRSPNVDETWLRQCGASGNLERVHPVFGASVSPSQVQISRLKEGGVIMTFKLPDYYPPLTSTELLGPDLDYPMVCTSGEYRASKENFVAAVRLALRNCY